MQGSDSSPGAVSLSEEANGAGSSRCEGSGRDRMTIMHEICHYITLCQLNFTLARSFEQDEIPVFCDPEWQAKCLAGEIMMPADKIYDMNPDEVSEKCGVSWPAAVFQLSKIYSSMLLKIA